MCFNERFQMDKITTTIKREWLREIAAGRKRVEYREIKPYWTRRFSRVNTPFLLRLEFYFAFGKQAHQLEQFFGRDGARAFFFYLGFAGRADALMEWERERLSLS